MRMDLLQTKQYKLEAIKYEQFWIAFFALILGTLPIGHIIVLPVLLYLAQRENRTQYIAQLGFVMGSLTFGWLIALIQLMMLMIWNACTQLANLTQRNQMTSICLVSSVLSMIIGWLLGYPVVNILILAVFQYIGFELLRKDFYQDEQMMITFALCITLLAIVSLIRRYMEATIGLAMIGGLLLYLSCILTTKKILYLTLLSYYCFSIGQTANTQVYLSVEEYQQIACSALPLLFVICFSAGKYKRWIGYTVVASILYLSIKQHTALLYTLVFSILVFFVKQDNQTIAEDHIPRYLNYRRNQKLNSTSLVQTNTLLHRFATIFSELAKRNPSLHVLDSVATAFALCEEELQSTYLKEQDVKKRVQEVLESYQFPVTRIVVEKHDVILIHLWIRKLHPSELEATIVPLLTNAFDIPFHILSNHKAGLFDSFHRITLSSEKGLSILYDQIQKPLDQECGDAILVKAWHETMHYMISDGMGSGMNARTQSTFVLSMLEKFMEANVPMKTSIKLVNQLALLQNEERYATLDVLSIDRFKKEALLYKSGCMQTYLLRGKQVYSFFSSSLPLGIITRINPEYYSIPLKEGDILLMVSDGGDHEKMQEWMKQSSEIHPSKMLRVLYEKRMEMPVNDDVSMVLIRVKNGVN